MISRSLIHYELISFVNGVSSSSFFIFIFYLHVAIFCSFPGNPVEEAFLAPLMHSLFLAYVSIPASATPVCAECSLSSSLSCCGILGIFFEDLMHLLNSGAMQETVGTTLVLFFNG